MPGAAPSGCATVRPLVDSLTLKLRRVLEDSGIAFRPPLLEIETQ